ncbi:PLDc N-terminal domain-containing protein [Mycetocola zhujimingii]|uniref:Cardiolipin synthase N-terminal domain-containing protein n=1 Tax=Mycetocola zhujimingii TaxID=2079792 RepID=A0A2U1TCK5_9MICO|nr:PLDc N-terminal domain-containing protein [Mycetocola zhujimingii]AWB86191.1 hypothetical protein C3E77_05915 [Mycetocola zhujimingii]PWC06627.1 hypothetical protein DF223_10180 [Mycetocola zhujimingii]
MTANPLLPVWFDIVWTLVLAVVVVSLVLALVQIARRRDLDAVARAAWVLVVIIAPIIGPVAWFAIGRRLPPPPSSVVDP